MRWEDAVIAACQLGFIAALVPALFSAQKPPRFTCWSTGALLLTAASALASLRLWWATGTMTTTGLCWLVLWAQQLRQRGQVVITLRCDRALSAQQVRELLEVLNQGKP